MNEKAIIETVKTAQPKLSREDLLQVLKYRYATKAWDRNRKIRDEDMQTILEAARLAPTSFGFEPWKIIVLQDQEIRQAIRPYAWGADAALQDASHFLVFLARKKVDITFGSPYLGHITHDIMELPEQAYNMFKQLIRDSVATNIKPSNPSGQHSTGQRNRPISSWPTSSSQPPIWASTPAPSRASRKTRSRRSLPTLIISMIPHTSASLHDCSRLPRRSAASRQTSPPPRRIRHLEIISFTPALFSRRPLGEAGAQATEGATARGHCSAPCKSTPKQNQVSCPPARYLVLSLHLPEILHSSSQSLRQ